MRLSSDKIPPLVSFQKLFYLFFTFLVLENSHDSDQDEVTTAKKAAQREATC